MSSENLNFEIIVSSFCINLKLGPIPVGKNINSRYLQLECRGEYLERGRNRRVKKIALLYIIS
jgi:hypothetical protein